MLKRTRNISRLAWSAALLLILFSCERYHENELPKQVKITYRANSASATIRQAMIIEVPNIGQQIAGDPKMIISLHGDLIYRINLAALDEKTQIITDEECIFYLPEPVIEANIEFQEAQLASPEGGDPIKPGRTALSPFIDDLTRAFIAQSTDATVEKLRIEVLQKAKKILDGACRGQTSKSRPVEIHYYPPGTVPKINR